VRPQNRWLGTARALFAIPAARIVPLSVLAGTVLSVGLGLGAARALELPSDTMPLAEVKPGMKGYGLTVFRGTTPEKFDVEVISTLHNFKPSMDLVLIKTPHPRLDLAKTVAGMSGSPIYLNGKMIGAYAYGWLFGAEAIAGVTPIKSMLEEMARPVPPGLVPRAGSPIAAATIGGSGAGKRSANSFGGAPEAYDLSVHAKQIAQRADPMLAAPDGTQLARASTPMMLGGMTNGAARIANELFAQMGLEPMQAGGAGGGQADPNAPTRFVDGGAIGVELVRGDVSAMGLGTVTRVAGDKLVAFGHPMLGGGIEALPTAIGKVHWILASMNRSFKIGEAARSMGALVNDRQSAIVVDSTARAPTYPMRIEILGAPGVPKPIWNVEVSGDQFMAPSFTAMAIGSAVEATTAERRDFTWRAESKLRIAKYGVVKFEDFATSSGNAVAPEDFVRSRVVRGLGALLNNPWEPVTIERVDTTVKVAFTQDVYRLRGAKVLEPEIDAGAPARIRIDLEPFQGKSETRVIEVKIPLELAGHDVEIELNPGYDVERPQPTPDSVAELVAVLPNLTYDPESIVASIRLRETGAAYHGKIASRLPPFASDQLRPTSDSDAPETFASLVHTAIPLKRFVVGHDAVRVTIRPVLR
jgi:SpoIVB peptidase S55